MTPPTGAREPVRGSGWVTALAAVLTIAGVKLAGLDPGTAGALALGLAPALAAEIGRRFAFSPATVRAREREIRTAAIAGELLAPTPVSRDPRWLRGYWPAWLAAVVLTFAVPETIAIVMTGEGGTLSEMTREWIGTSQGQTSAGWVVMTAAVAVAGTWWIGHTRKLWPWERSR